MEGPLSYLAQRMWEAQEGYFLLVSERVSICSSWGFMHLEPPNILDTGHGSDPVPYRPSTHIVLALQESLPPCPSCKRWVTQNMSYNF